MNDRKVWLKLETLGQIEIRLTTEQDGLQVDLETEWGDISMDRADIERLNDALETLLWETPE